MSTPGTIFGNRENNVNAMSLACYLLYRECGCFSCFLKAFAFYLIEPNNGLTSPSRKVHLFCTLDFLSFLLWLKTFDTYIKNVLRPRRWSECDQPRDACGPCVRLDARYNYTLLDISGTSSPSLKATWGLIRFLSEKKGMRNGIFPTLEL